MEFSDLTEKPVVQRYLHELVGPEGIQVALSPPEGEVTDEEIAEQLEVDVNVVRRTLIILNEHNLADYRRVRDNKSGWLTYLWTFRYERIPEQLEEEMEVLYESLVERKEYEKNNQFYLCDVCQMRFPFDEAISLEFSCPQCGEKLNGIDSNDLVELMERRIEELEEELEI